MLERPCITDAKVRQLRKANFFRRANFHSDPSECSLHHQLRATTNRTGINGPRELGFNRLANEQADFDARVIRLVRVLMYGPDPSILTAGYVEPRILESVI